MRPALLPTLALAFVACGSPLAKDLFGDGLKAETTLAPDPAVTYERDVRPIMEASCTACHASGGIAPFQLTTYDEVFAMRSAVKSAVEARRMPPYLAGPGCNTYAADPRLSDAQIATISQWVGLGAPKGRSVGDAGTPMARIASLPRVDHRLAAPAAYTPLQAPDDYHCFVMDWPATTDSFVTGFHVTPGNERVVHHVIAYIVGPGDVTRVRQLDDAEPGPGYTCFGGSGINGNQNWLGSWAPGGSAVMYPDGTGLLVRAGSKIVMQVHYNTNAAPEGQRADLTTLQVATAASVAKRAYLMPWTNPTWLSGNMPIPAGAAAATHAFQRDPTSVLGFITQQQIPSGAFRLHAASLHEHLLGKKGRVEIVRAGGAPATCLLDVPRWDFHWQRSYRLATPVVFNPGDQLKVSCEWDNSPANQPVVNGAQQAPRDVNWGEGTGDEMCLGVVYISEL